MNNRITFIHWNLNLIFNYKRPFDRDAWNRIPKIVEAIKNYDVCLLCETWLYQNELKRLASQFFPYQYTEPRTWYKPLNSGLLILSKIQLTDIEYHHFSRNSNWDVFLSKGILKATILDKYDLYLTHLQQGNSENNHYHRFVQVQECIGFIKRTRRNSNVILCGDFNCCEQENVNHPSPHYANLQDAIQRDKQFRQFTNALPVERVLLYRNEEDISSFLSDKALLNNQRVYRLEIPYNWSSLSDTTALALLIED